MHACGGKWWHQARVLKNKNHSLVEGGGKMADLGMVSKNRKQSGIFHKRKGVGEVSDGSIFH